jgi:hypothetical protein
MKKNRRSGTAATVRREESAAQITAFSVAPLYERRRHRSQTGATAGLEPEGVYKEIVTSGPRKLADLMQALLAFLGRNDMMAYVMITCLVAAQFSRINGFLQW